MNPHRCRALVLTLAVGWCFACAGPGDGESDGGVEQVILVGVDGLEWRVLEPLMAKGKVPHLARLADRGARGELITLAPAYSPVIWATIATGKLPHKHGITGFVPPDGGPPFTSNSRTTQALWNVLGDLGHPVAVVGWWTTWPAEPVRGALVSDRMMFNRFNLWLGAERAGEDLPGQTHPPELFEELVDLTRPDAAIEDEFFARFLPGLPRPRFERSLHDPWYEMLLVYARDRAYREMLDRVLERDAYDFVAYYLNGPDIASHYFWKHLFPDEWPAPIAPAELEAGREIIPRYYAWIDEAIGALLDRADEHTLVIVVSDHGFVTGRRPDSPSISGTHYRAAPPGVLILAGGGVPEGAELGRTTVMDLAPTILHALGHAVARDMDGQVLPLLVEAEPDRPVQFVESYDPAGGRGGVEPVSSIYDQAILDKLRALGYFD